MQFESAPSRCWFKSCYFPQKILWSRGEKAINWKNYRDLHFAGCCVVQEGKISNLTYKIRIENTINPNSIYPIKDLCWWALKDYWEENYSIKLIHYLIIVWLFKKSQMWYKRIFCNFFFYLKAFDGLDVKWFC